MNKRQLSEEVARRMGVPLAVGNEAVTAVLDAIVRAVVTGDTVTLYGLGTFTRREHAARSARNPQTGERVAVPARRQVHFAPGLTFRRLVSDGPTSTGSVTLRRVYTVPRGKKVS
ncbi:HU family DNA-binding protein [Streptomyces sp. NRRL S-350]|uniref:HU family DNA-binding protein n=1 Tax=Streptomyces sp. NRRL S-350 TaxID=1463902 RepID=UPI00068CDA94|nr:HU family DNA-binding protein [Streptomyces sp. NRRL S-350]